MAFTQPSAGYGHNFADKEASWITFTVTPTLPGGTNVLWTVADPKGLLTTMKMIRAVLGKAIDEYLVTNAAQLVTNNVVIGNVAPADFGGSNANKPPGDGFFLLDWDKVDRTAKTPAITTTSLTTDDIVVSVPYADVV